MRRLLIAILVLVLPSNAFSIVIADAGKSAYTIVVRADAAPVEKTAAKELQDHLKKVTGVEIPIATASSGPKILLGPSARLPDLKQNDLGHDGIVVRIVGDDIILAGGEPRGTLYAVYEFLENDVGVRWWTSVESFIPQKPRLEIDKLDTVYVPPLRYREAYYNDVISLNYQFAARCRLNGHMTDIPAEWGGHYTIIGWCHTFYDLVPPARHFAEHPEWFSLINGKRTASGAQLCLTNETMRKELVRAALRRIRKNPDAGIISIAQNDCFGPCQCEKCQAIMKEEGSESGPLIRFVNAVAEEIGREYPDFLIETLAYQYTRHPPAHAKPAKNVLVRLCSIECDFARPLSGATNKAFADDMRGWAAISPNLFVWNYVTDFVGYFLPHPNMTPLGEDLRWMVDNHVVGVFEQGDAFNERVGDFPALRTWLLAKLLWNPNLDQTRLRDEFLAGYYGAAGPALGKYLDLLNETARAKRGFVAPCYNTDLSFLTPEVLDQSKKLFADAERAVADDATLAKRVRRERLPLDLISLQRYDFDSKIKQAGKDTKAICSEYDRLVEEFASIARDSGAKHWSEGGLFEGGINGLRAACANAIPVELPPAGAQLSDGQFDVQQDRFRPFKKFSELTDDASASDGKAIRMRGGHGEWGIQFHLTADQPTGPGPWKCYVVTRVESKAKSGSAFQYGVWSGAGNIAHGGGTIERFGNGYRTLLITLPDLKPGNYFWIAPAGDVQNIFVDRIFFIRDGK